MKAIENGDIRKYVDDDIADALLTMKATLGTCLVRDIFADVYGNVIDILAMDNKVNVHSELEGRGLHYDKRIVDVVKRIAEINFNWEDIEHMLYFTIGPCYDHPLQDLESVVECMYRYCDCEEAERFGKDKFRNIVVSGLASAGVDAVVARVDSKAAYVVFPGSYADLIVGADENTNWEVFVRCVQRGFAIVDGKIPDAGEFLWRSTECPDALKQVSAMFKSLGTEELLDIARCIGRTIDSNKE